LHILALLLFLLFLPPLGFLALWFGYTSFFHSLLCRFIYFFLTIFQAPLELWFTFSFPTCLILIVFLVFVAPTIPLFTILVVGRLALDLLTYDRFLGRWGHCSI